MNGYYNFSAAKKVFDAVLKVKLFEYLWQCDPVSLALGDLMRAEIRFVHFVFTSLSPGNAPPAA
jgi:hypothetical protein